MSALIALASATFGCQSRDEKLPVVLPSTISSTFSKDSISLPQEFQMNLEFTRGNKLIHIADKVLTTKTEGQKVTDRLYLFCRPDEIENKNFNSSLILVVSGPDSNKKELDGNIRSLTLTKSISEANKNGSTQYTYPECNITGRIDRNNFSDSNDNSSIILTTNGVKIFKSEKDSNFSTRPIILVDNAKISVTSFNSDT